MAQRDWEEVYQKVNRADEYTATNKLDKYFERLYS